MSDFWTPERVTTAQDMRGRGIAFRIIGETIGTTGSVVRSKLCRLQRRKPKDPGAFEWTERALATLRRLANEGHSSTEIAATLGASRSAVTGKAWREGIPLTSNERAMRGALASSAKAGAKRAQPSLPQILSAPTPPVSDAGAGKKTDDLRFAVAMLGAAPERADTIVDTPSVDMTGQSSAGVTLFDLQRNSCRFPVSGEGIGTIFCGAKAEEGRSYCPNCYPRTIAKSGGGAFVFHKRNGAKEAA